MDATTPRPVEEISQRPRAIWIARLVGTVLALAAVLKLAGLGVETVGSLSILADPSFQILVIEIEIALAVWLWSKKNPVGAWLTAVVLFATFAVVSFRLAAQGQTSCGCFGAIRVNPGLAFVLDVMLLAASAYGRPNLTGLWTGPRAGLANAVKPALLCAGGIALLLAIMVGSARHGFGSVEAAIAHFRGERVSVRPRVVDVGADYPGQQKEATVEVANWTDQPIRVVGGTQDCSCTVLHDLPMTIPANESRPVSIRMSLSGKPGNFARKAAFLVDDDGFKRISFQLTGRILEPERNDGEPSAAR